MPSLLLLGRQTVHSLHWLLSHWHILQTNADRRSVHESRQLDYISLYTCDIIHILGTNNAVADTLLILLVCSLPSLLDIDLPTLAAQQPALTSLDITPKKLVSCQLKNLPLPSKGREYVWHFYWPSTHSCSWNMFSSRCINCNTPAAPPLSSFFLIAPFGGKCSDILFHGPAHVCITKNLKWTANFAHPWERFNNWLPRYHT